ncbi:MAG: 6-carboxytetrahydropterin synthase [Aquificae bacterium]|nr:6-carboxytetrahydropterin synthase [Aquificota bacterium]
MPWRVRVRKKFEAAHYLTDYPERGQREPLHGHSWTVEAVFRVERLKPSGIDLDFVEVERFLDEVLPHYRLLNEVYDFSPSAENLARHLYGELKRRFPQLERVIVWETENGGAEYWED